MPNASINRISHPFVPFGLVSSPIIPQTTKTPAAPAVIINGSAGFQLSPSCFTLTQFATIPMPAASSKIHQFALSISAIVRPIGARIHDMESSAPISNAKTINRMHTNTNPLPSTSGTSSIKMYILTFLPYPPNKFAPGAKRAALRPERCLWYAEFYCRSR